MGHAFLNQCRLSGGMCIGMLDFDRLAQQVMYDNKTIDVKLQLYINCTAYSDIVTSDMLNLIAYVLNKLNRDL